MDIAYPMNPRLVLTFLTLLNLVLQEAIISLSELLLIKSLWLKWICRTRTNSDGKKWEWEKKGDGERSKVRTEVTMKEKEWS